MGARPHRPHRTEKGSNRCGAEARHPDAPPLASQPRLLSPSETESPDRYRVGNRSAKEGEPTTPVGSTSIELTSKGSCGEQPTNRSTAAKEGGSSPIQDLSRHFECV